MAAETETYPTPLNAGTEEFPTPVEAANKGLNPNPEPLLTGLSDMPELPELTHAHGEHVDAHVPVAEGAQKQNGKKNGNKAEDLHPAPGKDLHKLVPSFIATEPATVSTESKTKHRAEHAKNVTKSKAERVGREVRKEYNYAKGKVSGWMPRSLGEAWDRYWWVGVAAAAGVVAVGVVRNKPQILAWINRARA